MFLNSRELTVQAETALRRENITNDRSQRKNVPQHGDYSSVLQKNGKISQDSDMGTEGGVRLWAEET